MKNFFLLCRISTFHLLLVGVLLVSSDGLVFAAAKKTSAIQPKTPPAPPKQAAPAPPKAATPPPATPKAPPAPTTTSKAPPVAPAPPKPAPPVPATTSKAPPVPAAPSKPAAPAPPKPAPPVPATTSKAPPVPAAPSKPAAPAPPKAATPPPATPKVPPAPTTTSKAPPVAPAPPKAADATASKPEVPAQTPAKTSLWGKLTGKSSAPATSDVAADPSAPAPEKKPSLLSRLSGAVNNAGGVGGIAALAGGAANNPLLQIAAQKVGAGGLLNKAASAANVAGAAASGDVAGAIAGAGSLTGVLPPSPAPDAVPEEPAADPAVASVEPQDPVVADSAVVAANQVAVPVAAPGAQVVVPVAVSGQPVASVQPAVLAQVSGVAAPIVGGARADSAVVSAFIQALVEELRTAEFNASSLVVPFTASGMQCVVTIPLHPGLSNQEQPFNPVMATIDAGSPESVKSALMPLLTISPEEVFVIKVILMLNTARKQLGADFDDHDFILVNLPMLLYRLEKTKDGLYARSSHAAIEAIRSTYRPILALMQFPSDPWYERVVNDMPNGEATPFMKEVSKMRWQAGHEDRTKIFTARLLPSLKRDSSPLEKAFFEYAILEQLQEYDGGFVAADSADFIKRVIDSRLVLLEPMLRAAVTKMQEAGCDASAIAKVNAFIEGIPTKSRLANSDVESLVPITIPAVPIEGLGTGVDYFLKVVDPFMRWHVIHRKIHGDRGYTYFDFGYSSDQAKEALVALVIRSLRGMPKIALEEELTDIYFRSDHAVVDGLLGRLASTPGYKVSDIQGAVAKAKKQEKEVVEEEHDDAVMEESNI